MTQRPVRHCPRAPPAKLQFIVSLFSKYENIIHETLRKHKGQIMRHQHFSKKRQRPAGRCWNYKSEYRSF